MLLVQVRVVGLGPLDDVTFRFADEAGAPRRTTVVLGGGGVGKTMLLAALASTRPGYAVVQRPRRVEVALQAQAVRASEAEKGSFVVTDWALAAEDPTRPHVLRVASPNAALGEEEDVALLRRREQALFDRRAGEGGYALVAFSGARWFSRTSVLLGGAERSLARHDPRAPASFDDPTRADLARETKQALSFPVVSAALARATPRYGEAALARADSLDRAMRDAVAPLARLAGYRFVGADPASFEPVFERIGGGAVVAFDELPTHARHLAAFGALTVRALHAAWPGADARTAEGVVLLDDADLHLDAAARRDLVPTARRFRRCSGS